MQLKYGHIENADTVCDLLKTILPHVTVHQCSSPTHDDAYKGENVIEKLTSYSDGNDCCSRYSSLMESDGMVYLVSHTLNCEFYKRYCISSLPNCYYRAIFGV